MIRGRWWLPLLALCLAGPAPAQAMSWQDAVAQLAQERTQAETCAAALKKHGDAAAVDRGAPAYGQAKAEYDGIIAGLDVVLAQKAEPVSLTDLQGRLRRGFEQREAFCRAALSLVPPRAAGEKGVLDEIAKGAIGPVLQAVQAIYLRAKDDSALTRATIRTQLEATSWPAFAAVAP